MTGIKFYITQPDGLWNQLAPHPAVGYNTAQASGRHHQKKWFLEHFLKEC